MSARGDPESTPAETDVTLAPATQSEEDALLVMLWRNDPATLAASFHGEPRSWPAFLGDYRAYFDADPPPLFALAGGERVAFLRFRPCADPLERGRVTRDISVNVAPAARGRGLGRRIVAAASAHALVGCEVLLAEIKPDNVASIRVFAGAGYHAIGPSTHDVDGTRIAVERWIRER